MKDSETKDTKDTKETKKDKSTYDFLIETINKIADDQTKINKIIFDLLPEFYKKNEST